MFLAARIRSEGQHPEPLPSSPAPVQAGSSTLFDSQSALSSADNKKASSAELASTSVAFNPSSVHPEFAFSDGNIEVQTTGQVFWVHEYQLNKFSVIASLIQEARANASASDRRIKIDCVGESADFCNAFRVIYASIIPRSSHSAPQFDSATFISALRIASAYNYPDLRSFAISQLEKLNLSPIKRIQLSDEFSLPAWETPAYAELCRRTEPISSSEAQILGIGRFVEIARIREAEQHRQLVETVDKLVKPHSLLNGDGTVNEDNLQRDAEYSCQYSSLPACNCRAENNPPSAFGGFGGAPSQINRVACEIHTIAPRILTESHTLFKQRNDLLEQLGNVKRAMSTKRAMEIASIESELQNAQWVRGAAKSGE